MKYNQAIKTLKPSNLKPVTFTSRDGLQWSSRTGLAKMEYYDFNTTKEAREFRRKEYLGLKSLSFLNEDQAKRYKKLLDLVVRDNRAAFNEAE